MRADQTFLRSMGLRTAGRFGLAVVLAAASLAGCAKAPPASDPAAVADYRATNDPLEPTNRFFYDVSINDIDPYTLKPVAQAYVYVVPRPVRTGIHNMLVDYGQPVTFLNGILEGKPRRTGDSFVRFLLNTTVGVGGFFDVAKELGYRQGCPRARTCSCRCSDRRTRVPPPGSSASIWRFRPSPTCPAAMVCSR